MFDNRDSKGIDGLVIPLADERQGVAKILNPNARPDALAIQFSVLDGEILLDFGQPLQWVRFTQEQASKVIADLEQCVRYARTLHGTQG